MDCPCLTGELYGDCCGRFISLQIHPENAEQLMRSRYSAYVLCDNDYLNKTWHPDYRPADLKLEPNLCWINLNVIGSSATADQATVEFEASFVMNGRVESLHEKSDFLKVDGQWLYTTGEMLPATHQPWKPGRNELCPCGSGKKFKRCCGR